MEKYIPKPLDTSGVKFDKELSALCEALAKNVHEVWSAGKLAEGWTYGERLDTEKKTHPSLVAYEELSESQKDYDRRTSRQTLAFVIASGFTIKKN
ncbi:MAG: Ryanodine receptor Ryr [Clostridia bacterium]|nr:Ryanodine receptor Ryr [Clostridia bacterium]